MKFTQFLLAAAVCATTAASAQTTPTQTAPRTSTTLTPSSAAPALNPNSADNTRALPPTGAPDAIDNTTPTGSNGTAKGKKHKSASSSDKSKVKGKM
jgi:hypothetical protein